MRQSCDVHLKLVNSVLGFLAVFYSRIRIPIRNDLESMTYVRTNTDENWLSTLVDKI